MKKSLLPAVLAGSLGTSLLGCASPHVLQGRPAVRFTEPAGAVMFIQSEGGVLRAVFDGRQRNPPVVCEENLAQVNTAKKGASLSHTLAQFARHRGSATVQLLGSDGKILGKGRLCIFPLLRTKDADALKGYLIQVPLEVFRRTRKGKPAVVFQAYAPELPDGPGWQHIAWVLWFAPDL